MNISHCHLEWTSRSQCSSSQKVNGAQGSGLGSVWRLGTGARHSPRKHFSESALPFLTSYVLVLKTAITRNVNTQHSCHTSWCLEWHWTFCQECRTFSTLLRLSSKYPWGTRQCLPPDKDLTRLVLDPICYSPRSKFLLWHVSHCMWCDPCCPSTIYHDAWRTEWFELRWKKIIWSSPRFHKIKTGYFSYK